MGLVSARNELMTIFAHNEHIPESAPPPRGRKPETGNGCAPKVLCSRQQQQQQQQSAKIQPDNHGEGGRGGGGGVEDKRNSEQSYSEANPRVCSWKLLRTMSVLLLSTEQGVCATMGLLRGCLPLIVAS